MSAITSKSLTPKVWGNLRREIAVRDAAMCGDILMVITPETVSQDATAAIWSRTVTVEIKTADGRLHDWLTGNFTTKVSIADTSVAGTASISSTTLAIINGSATITVSGDAAAWIAEETNTLTIANITVLGITVTGGTSVGTFE